MRAVISTIISSALVNTPGGHASMICSHALRSFSLKYEGAVLLNCAVGFGSSLRFNSGCVLNEFLFFSNAVAVVGLAVLGYREK